ncbi:PepSY domain-containing protein [Bacillus sp. B190/17]|uniref:PepSY domain-containing protein n=1 Tax=Bacillus lumedeiriae TaxID=3058829 RepID=A0ABW8I9B4_9BACI
MKKKINKFVIPALAAIVIGGGATGAVYASAVKGGTVQQEELNDRQEQDMLAKQAKISEKESIQIALGKVAGTVKEAELDDEDGTVIYEIKVQGKDGSEQEVKVDAQTGKVINVEKEEEDDDDQQEQEMLAKQAKISEKESIQIALGKVAGTVKEVELDDEDGTVIYEVKVQGKDGSEQEVKVDAQTGKVIGTEKED